MYINQQLDFEFQLVNPGQTFIDGSNVKRIFGARCTASINTAGGTYGLPSKFTIWGMNFDDLSVLTSFPGWHGYSQFNRIIVKANNVTVYKGTITSCMANFNSAPDVPLNIECVPAAFLMTSVNKPFSKSGEVAVSEIIEEIIKPFNMTLTNHNVTKTVTNPYLEQSPFLQINQLIKSVGCWVEFTYDQVIISNKDRPATNREIYLSPETGLIGYPMYYQNFLNVKSYFNPSYTMQTKINLNSALPLSNGSYSIIKINHDLSCNVPGGKFESNLLIVRNNYNENAN